VERNDVLGRFEFALRIRDFKTKWKDRQLAKLAARLRIHVTTLHDYARLAEQWRGAKGELEALLGQAKRAGYLISWSHLVELWQLDRSHARFTKTVDAAIKNRFTVRELAAYVADGVVPADQNPKQAGLGLARLATLAARHVENLGRITWRRIDDGLEQLPADPSKTTRVEVRALAQAHEACSHLADDATTRAKKIETFLATAPSGPEVLTKVRAELKAVADKQAKRRTGLKLVSDKKKAK
jgi:hypothetical protein